MKTLIFCGLIILVMGCREKGATAEPDSVAKMDSSALPPAEKQNDSLSTTVYLVQDSLDTKRYKVSVQTLYIVPPGRTLPDIGYGEDNYLEGRYLIVTDKLRQVSDTLLLAGDAGTMNAIQIADLTDSLKIAPLLIQINSTGSSDYAISDFVGYKNDSLQLLFSIDGGLNVISRKDAKTIAGLHYDRDEVVAATQDDYRFTVSLEDYTVKYEDPPIQKIDYSTEALEKIKAYRRTTNRDSIVYTIKKGTNLRVDTFYRTTNMVRLIMPDSTVVFINADSLKYKIQVNEAG